MLSSGLSYLYENGEAGVRQRAGTMKVTWICGRINDCFQKESIGP